jgi:hypothetical protein
MYIISPRLKIQLSATFTVAGLMEKGFPKEFPRQVKLDSIVT